MDLQRICDYAEKIFALPTKETEGYLKTKIVSDKDRERLFAILNAVESACLRFHFDSDTKDMQRAGRVVFSELDYSKFAEDETPAETGRRLKEVFSQTSKLRDINPYKIMYCQVLTDGNLRNDHEKKIKFRDESRFVENIYEELKFRLALSDKETCEKFERCSTLISKISSYKIFQIYDAMTSKFVIFDNKNCKSYFFFDEKEVQDILKVNPSLFTCSADKVKEAFIYLKNRVSRIAKQSEKQSKFWAEYSMLKQWLKENSSLLSINVQNMLKKEAFLFESVDKEEKSVFVEQFKSFFGTSTNIAIMNEIQYEKMTKNFRKNLETLKSVFSVELIKTYLESNPYVLGFDSDKFEKLVRHIQEEDRKHPEKNLLQKFFMSGKSIFNGSTEFSENRVLSKLKNGNLVKAINLDKMTNEEKISKFVEIFMNGDKKVEEKIFKLILEKTKRENRGERILRQNIKQAAEDVSRLQPILKDKDFSIKEKNTRILQLFEDINKIQNMRLKLVAEDTLSCAIASEEQLSKEVSNMFKLIGDAYEQKHFEIESQFMGANALYGSVVGYLKQIFIDKESINALFQREISKKYVDSLKENYVVSEDEQATLFGERLHVAEVDPRFMPGLKNLTREILKDDVSMPQISFDK